VKRLFITCGQGLEPLLCNELLELGFEQTHSGYRGVYVDISSFEDIYKINYCSRIGGRVLLPLLNFRCHDSRSLYKKALDIDWSLYIPPGKSFAIDPNVNHPQLRNSLFAAQVLKDAICDQLKEKRGYRPDVNPKNPDIQLNLFINPDQAIICFDTSGTPLHKRGYRQESVEAPLQESLAAALLRLAEYTGQEILFDPCCGSGTFLIEAALMTTRTPPGFLRTRWGFMHLNEFNPDKWLKAKIEVDQHRIPLPHGLLSGMDINKDAVRICRTNLRAAGFHQAVEVIQGDFRDYEPSKPPNFIITNPPHGKRLNEVDQLRTLYRALGDFFKRKTSKPSRAFVFTGNLELAKEVGLAPRQRHVIHNSGIESRFLAFDLY
jgi:putative N6-adenine-specific DNA methylase